MVSTTTNTFVIYQILSFKQQTDYYELGVKYLADDNKDISTFINNENFKIQLVQEDKEVVKDIQDSKDLPVSKVTQDSRDLQDSLVSTGFQGMGYQGFQGFQGYQGDIINWWNTYDYTFSDISGSNPTLANTKTFRLGDSFEDFVIDISNAGVTSGDDAKLN